MIEILIFAAIVLAAIGLVSLVVSLWRRAGLPIGNEPSPPSAPSQSSTARQAGRAFARNPLLNIAAWILVAISLWFAYRGCVYDQQAQDAQRQYQQSIQRLNRGY